MKGHFLVPSTVFNDEALRLPLVALHVLSNQFLENHRELVGNFLNRLLLELLDIANNSIVSVLSDKLELSIEAVIELRHEHFYEFFLHFFENFLVVLLRGAFVVFSRLLHYLEASLTELLDDCHIALRRQSLNLLLHLLESLVLDLPTPVIGDHFSLAWQVKFFLVADDSPRSFDEEWHAVKRYVLRAFSGGQKDRIGSSNFKSGLQLTSLFGKRVWLKDLVRHHDELEREKLLGRRICELFWLVDLAPDLIQIFVDHCLDLLELDAVVVVAEDKEEFLVGLLLEKLQVDLEDDLEQPVVGGAVPTDVRRPHVDEEYVRHGQRKQGSGLLESLS